MSGVRPSHGRLQPSAGPGHPLRRRRHELQERRHPGDRGPDGRSVVAGQEAAEQHGVRRAHPLHQPAETVGRVCFGYFFIHFSLWCTGSCSCWGFYTQGKMILIQFSVDLVTNVFCKTLFFFNKRSQTFRNTDLCKWPRQLLSEINNNRSFKCCRFICDHSHLLICLL